MGHVTWVMWLECDGSSFHFPLSTNFKLNGKTVTVDKTGETRLKCGEKPTLLCRTWAKSYHVKDHHMLEVKHERNGTGLFSIFRRILQVSMIVKLNSLYKWNLPSNTKYNKAKMVNFLPTTSQPNRFWNANFPPYISPSEYKPLKKGIWKI